MILGSRLRHTISLLLVLAFGFNSSGQTLDVGPPDTSACSGTPIELTAVFTGTNISTAGVIPTNVTLSDDSYTGVIDLGFTFEFYGNSYTQCLIASNNYITFDLTDASGYSPWAIGAPLPDPQAPVNSIMCPWQDINPGLGGTISYATFGTAPNRVFVVSYFEVPMFSCTGDCFTNQIVLYEGTNTIETHIFEKPLCENWNGGAAIHGVHNSDGTVAHVVPGRDYPTQWTTTVDGYRFTPDGLGGYILDPIPFSPFPMGITSGITWTDDQNNQVGNTASITVSPTVPTLYTATWSSSCTSATLSDSILVTLGNVDVSVSPTDASCFNSSDGAVFIDPTGSTYPVTLDISDDNGTTLQTLNGVNGTETVGGFPSGDYTTTVTDQVGCVTSVDFTIDQPTALIPNANHTDILCSGDDNGSAWTNPSGGIPPYQFQWNDPLQQNIDSIQYLTAGAYTITVTDANGCESDTTISIIEPLPLILDLSSGADTCLYKNGAVRAEIQGGTVPIYYNWTSLGGDSANFSLDSINYSWSMISNLPHGNYGVLVTDTNGCTAEGSIEVELINPPYSQFSSRSKPIEFTDPDVQYVNESSAALTYEWHFGDGEISYEEDPEHRYDTSGVFLVMLIAYNEPRYGCADTSFQYMQVDPLFTFYVPSAFTPDGDGLNDTWGPVGQNFEYESYNVKIYDRWGKLIWQTDNPSLQWDGMFENGKEVKQGMYVYVFTLKEFNTFEPKITKGTVTLYRHN